MLTRNYVEKSGLLQWKSIFVNQNENVYLNGAIADNTYKRQNRRINSIQREKKTTVQRWMIDIIYQVSFASAKIVDGNFIKLSIDS